MKPVLWMKSSCTTYALMVQDNNLLKRPILVHPKGVIIGFDSVAYEKLIS